MQNLAELRPSHVIGYRIFEVDIDGMVLHSVSGVKKNNIWLPGEIKTASCRVLSGLKEAHVDQIIAPHPDCTCGIWSCLSRSKLEKVYPSKMLAAAFRLPVTIWNPTTGRMSVGKKYQFFVSARVEQWGIVMRHADGYRSQYARIIPDTIHAYPRVYVSTHQKKLIPAIREKYMREAA